MYWLTIFIYKNNNNRNYYFLTSDWEIIENTEI